jgi:hypothetical protein
MNLTTSPNNEKVTNKNSSNTEQKLTEIQNEIDEFKMIIMDNMEKIIYRGTNLDTLERSCEMLAAEAGQFQLTCTRVKRNNFFKNKQLCVVLTLVSIITGVLSVLIFLILMYHYVWKI